MNYTWSPWSTVSNVYMMYMTAPHRVQPLNTLRPSQDGRHFPDDIFKCIFFQWKYINFDYDFTEISSQDPNNNIPSLFQIMACRLTGAKPLSETMMISWLTHICVTRPQLVIQCYNRTRISFKGKRCWQRYKSYGSRNEMEHWDAKTAGLAPNRRHAIIWTNADQVLWRCMASPWTWEWTLRGHVTHICVSNLDHHSFR